MIGIGYNMISELLLLPYLKENSGQMGFTLKTQWPLPSSTAWMWSRSMLCSSLQLSCPLKSWIPASFIPSTLSNCIYFVAQYWMTQKMFVHWPETWFRKTAGSHLSHGFFSEENVCCCCSYGKGRGSRHAFFTHSALVSCSIVHTRGTWEMAASKGYLAFHSALLPLSRTYDRAVSPGSLLKEALRLMWGASYLHSDEESILLWRWRGLESEQ